MFIASVSPAAAAAADELDLLGQADARPASGARDAASRTHPIHPQQSAPSAVQSPNYSQKAVVCRSNKYDYITFPRDGGLLYSPYCGENV